MGKLIILDRTGDTTVLWDENNLAEAERVYNELVGLGRIPIRTDDNTKLHKFDSNAKEVVMVPKVVGG